MKLPVDRRALPGFILLSIMIMTGSLIARPLGLFFLIVLPIHLAFFRDPKRTPPAGHSPVSPADGTISDISIVYEERFLKEEAVKIGIFLSVFVAHVNRSPGPGKVCYLQYEPGKFLNALDKECVKVNESNWVGVEGDGRCILIRQISGAIARRIHCDVGLSQMVSRGEKIGIICYGSRAECYIPKRLFKPIVQIGDFVKAGETILGEWIS